MLAKKSSNTKEHYAYGFAAASVGFAAMGAYIYLTKSKKKVNNEKNQQLIDSDFEFQMVWSFRYDEYLCSFTWTFLDFSFKVTLFNTLKDTFLSEFHSQ